MVQEEGVKVELPEINTSELGFSPLIEENEILFGLKGICGINNDTVKTIVENRPYSSLQDFYERLVKTTREVTLSTGKIQNKSYVSKGQLITLIKAGAFDKLENENRETILSNFLKLLQPDKESLTTSNINSVVEMGIVSEDKKIYIRYYNFKNFLQEFSDIKDEKSKNIKWKVIKCDNDELTQYTLDFLDEHFMSEMEEGKGYKYDEEGNLLVALGTKRKGSFEKVYDNLMTEFKEWLNSKECLTLYNNIRFKDLQEEYMKGSLSTWEMESLGMYYHEHELAHVNKEKYSIVNFNELPEEPVIIDYNYYNPETDPALYLNYSAADPSGKTGDKLALEEELSLPAEADVPTLAIISRLASHKGLDLVCEIAYNLIDELDCRLIVLGKGESRYEDFFRQLESDRHDRVRALIQYDRELSRRIYAGADVFVMPSRREPCGLSQMIASRYGAIPVVRETGGLYDSIKGYWEQDGELHGNGFTFANYSSHELYDRIRAALELWRDAGRRERFVRKIMNIDFSWGASAARYQQLYRELTAEKGDI